MAEVAKANKKKLPLLGFIGLTIVYLAIIKVTGLLVGSSMSTDSGKLATVGDITYAMIIPLGLALLFVYLVIAKLGWMKEVFHETKRVRRWVWVVPIIFIIAILLGINYTGLSEKGLGFTLALLFATQLVGWGEEGMFRGLGVTVLRQYHITEGKVALWSSVIFGAVHISNILGGDTKAFAQAIAVSFAGYFFYLIRRVSGSNILNSIIHGLFDFTIIAGTGLLLQNDKPYIGATAAILVYIIVGIVLLIGHKKIEPAK